MTKEDKAKFLVNMVNDLINNSHNQISGCNGNEDDCDFASIVIIAMTCVISNCIFSYSQTKYLHLALDNVCETIRESVAHLIASVPPSSSASH